MNKILPVVAFVIAAALAYMLREDLISRKDAEAIVTAIGVALAVSGALSAFLSQSIGRKTTISENGASHLDMRLKEVRSEIARVHSLERWNLFSSRSLLFAQYVVGGLLATSFVQESLSSQIIGLLGLVVVAASAWNQHFRPAAMHRAACFRRVSLQKVLREAEDEIFAITQGREGAPSEYKVAKLLSRGLNEAAEAEMEEPEAHDPSLLKRKVL